jgi:hypothetical protein
MNLIPWYVIECTNCKNRIGLLETMLEQIFHGRLWSSTGEPFLTLVCPKCKTWFRYNYEERSPLGEISELPRTPDREYPVLFSLLAECDDSNCNSQIELIAIRDFGTSKEMMRREIPTWKLGGLVCEQGHQVIRPEPEKLS